METIKTVRLLFEQSGTFKSVFRSLNYNAYDYDIENQFGETDFQLDIFKEINNAYEQKESIFDTFDKEDLILAFFPCTYFSVQNELIWSRKNYGFKTWTKEKFDDYIENRLKTRDYFFNILLKFIEVVKRLEFKTVIENPFTGNYLLTRNEIKPPDIIISNRRLYGDYYKKNQQCFIFIILNQV